MHTDNTGDDAPYEDNWPHREYDLVVRQQPKQARMCGVGGKADRRPIDPPPIIQLRVRELPRDADPAAPHSPADYRDVLTFLENPYYFMFASLAAVDTDEEMHLLKDGKTRCTTGSVVSSLYHLKDTENQSVDAGFFVFPDLSVRTEGSYRLKLSLFEVVGTEVHHCKSIFSKPFYVYTAKKFPGMEESTALSCSLADQGIKIRIRKDIRVRKRQAKDSWEDRDEYDAPPAPVPALHPYSTSAPARSHYPLAGPSGSRPSPPRAIPRPGLPPPQPGPSRPAVLGKRTRTDEYASEMNRQEPLSATTTSSGNPLTTGSGRGGGSSGSSSEMTPIPQSAGGAPHPYAPHHSAPTHQWAPSASHIQTYGSDRPHYASYEVSPPPPVQGPYDPVRYAAGSHQQQQATAPPPQQHQQQPQQQQGYYSSTSYAHQQQQPSPPTDQRAAPPQQHQQLAYPSASSTSYAPPPPPSTRQQPQQHSPITPSPQSSYPPSTSMYVKPPQAQSTMGGGGYYGSSSGQTQYHAPPSSQAAPQQYGPPPPPTHSSSYGASQTQQQTPTPAYSHPPQQQTYAQPTSSAPPATYQPASGQPSYYSHHNSHHPQTSYAPPPPRPPMQSSSHQPYGPTPPPLGRTYSQSSVAPTSSTSGGPSSSAPSYYTTTTHSPSSYTTATTAAPERVVPVSPLQQDARPSYYAHEPTRLPPLLGPSGGGSGGIGLAGMGEMRRYAGEAQAQAGAGGNGGR